MKTKTERLQELDDYLASDTFDVGEMSRLVARLDLTRADYMPLLKKRSKRLRAEVERLDKEVAAAKSLIVGLESYSAVHKKITELKETGSRQAIEMLESSFPDFFKKSYPRRFEIPSAFHSPKQFSLCVFLAMHRACELKQDEGGIKNEDLHIAKTISLLVEKIVPTYFASEGIMEALTNTDLPKDFLLNDMPWPLDAMLFVLPKGMVTAQWGELCFVVTAKITERIYDSQWMNWGKMDSLIRRNEVAHKGRDSACLIGVTSTGRVLQWEHPIDSTSIFDASNTSITTSDIAEFKVVETTPEEKQFTVETLPKVAFQLILAMLACPEMIEGGIVVRVGSTKKGKTKHELWSPNFFGKAYRKYDMIVGSPDEAQHRRPHWRRGHFRHQRYGEGNRAIRVVWIKPILINKSRMEEMSAA